MLEAAGAVLVAAMLALAESIRRSRRVEKEVRTGNGGTTGEYVVRIAEKVESLERLHSVTQNQQSGALENQKLLRELIEQAIENQQDISNLASGAQSNQADLRRMLVGLDGKLDAHQDTLAQHVKDDEANFAVIHSDLKSICNRIEE